MTEDTANWIQSACDSSIIECNYCNKLIGYTDGDLEDLDATVLCIECRRELLDEGG